MRSFSLSLFLAPIVIVRRMFLHAKTHPQTKWRSDNKSSNNNRKWDKQMSEVWLMLHCVIFAKLSNKTIITMWMPNKWMQKKCARDWATTTFQNIIPKKFSAYFVNSIGMFKTMDGQQRWKRQKTKPFGWYQAVLRVEFYHYKYCAYTDG